MKRLLVTGANGLLGSKVVKLAQQSFEVVPTHHTRSLLTGSVGLDVANGVEVLKVVARLKPDVLVHVAAETRVDHCEKNREEAWRVNAEGTKNIAMACRKIKSKLIYVSTDYVFDGEKGLYVEIDEPNPVNYYGLTKLRGEEFVKENCQNHVVARTSVLYGWHSMKTNFALWVIESLRRGESITVVDDHYNSPTLADNLAGALVEMAKQDICGFFHTAGNERIGRYKFAVKIAKTFGLDESMIKPVKMNELSMWIARRPRDSSLCIDKVQKRLEKKFMSVEESLRTMKMNQNESSVGLKN